MDENVEKRAANILLERGVKVPVTAPLFLRLFGKKTISLIISAPTIATLTRIAEHYLALNIKNTQELTLPESFELLKKHSKTLSIIIATIVLNKRYKYWMIKPVAHFLRGAIPMAQLTYLFQLIILYGGIEDFINTIRLTEATRITMPMNLSQTEKTS